MAIFHLKVRNISRGKGKTAVGTAAYISASKMRNEEIGLNFNYSNKKGVVHSEIFAPQEAPSWVYDRQTLWGNAEKSDKRKDARVAREVLVALPVELGLDEQKELLKDYCQQAFVSQGMIADANIHHDNLKNPHAHILLTTRTVSENGFGLKDKAWNARSQIVAFRKQWSLLTNSHLLNNGHQIKVDDRSLKDLGVDLEANLHLGPQVHQMSLKTEARNEKPLDVYLRALDILRENGNQVLQNPDIAIQKITSKKAVFSEYDMAKSAGQCSADIHQYEEVFSSVLKAPSLVSLGRDERNKEIWTSRDGLKKEQDLLNRAKQLHLQKGHGVDEKTIYDILGQRTLTPSQKEALPFLASEGDLKILLGMAGSGKSFLMGCCKDVWEKAGYTVKGGALSGIAALSLEQGSKTEKSAGIKSRTLHSWLLSWKEGKALLSSQDIFVIDEAGMLGTEQLGEMLNHVSEAGAKAIIITDPQQTQPIAAGSPCRAFLEKLPFAKLEEVFRQKNDLMREATMWFCEGKSKEALELYEALGCIDQSAPTLEAAKEKMVDDWFLDREKGTGSQIMLTHMRVDVHDLNQKARSKLLLTGEIKNEGQLFNVKDSKERKNQLYFSPADRVYFLKNDKQLGVKNGTLGTIEQITGEQFTIRLDESDKEKKEISFNLKDYNYLDYGYAATIHKSQGVTVDQAYFLASPLSDKHLTYVALSRHRNDVKVYGNQEDFNLKKDFAAKPLLESLSKSGLKGFASLYEPQKQDAPSLEEKKAVNVKAFCEEKRQGYLANIRGLLAQQSGGLLTKSAQEALEKKNLKELSNLCRDLKEGKKPWQAETEKTSKEIEKSGNSLFIQAVRLEKDAMGSAFDPAIIEILKSKSPEELRTKIQRTEGLLLYREMKESGAFSENQLKELQNSSDTTRIERVFVQRKQEFFKELAAHHPQEELKKLSLRQLQERKQELPSQDQDEAPKGAAGEKTVSKIQDKDWEIER